MDARPFDTDAAPGDRRAVIRRGADGVEMVELCWGLERREPGSRPVTVICSEGRRFPSHRCLVPASAFRRRRAGRRYSFALADRDWFYFAGLWRPATRNWPEAYAILTTAANPDVAPYHDRQMAVLRRDQRMAWLSSAEPESDLLRPLPAGTFTVAAPRAEPSEAELAL